MVGFGVHLCPADRLRILLNTWSFFGWILIMLSIFLDDFLISRRQFLF